MGKTKTCYIREPAYFKNFHCIGGECPETCCTGWQIGWRAEEYDKIINADISPKFRELIQTNFEKLDIEPGKIGFDYQVKLAPGSKCSLLTPEGLCSIQKELGEEYLSKTCRVYPRVGFFTHDTCIRTCQLSCIQVFNSICSDENSMLLETQICKDEDCRQHMTVHTPFDNKDRINHPAVKFDREIFEFFYEILSEKSRSIETSIVLIALAAQKMDEYVKKGKADKIPEIIKALRPQLDDPAQIEKLENTKSNLTLKGNIPAAILKKLNGAVVEKNVFENGVPSEEKWQEGMDKWNAAFGSRPFVLRNITLNLFISNRMPFRDISYNLFDNIRFLAAEISAVKFLAAAVSVNYGNAEKTFAYCVSLIDRSFSHNKVNTKQVIDILNSAGINSPAYIMGILR